MANILTLNTLGNKIANALNRALYDVLGDLEYDYDILTTHVDMILERATEDEIDDVPAWLLRVAETMNVTPSRHDYNSRLYNTIEALGIAFRRVAFDWEG